MATMTDLARLSAAVYDFSSVEGWRPVGRGRPGGRGQADGLQAQAYSNGQDTVVAFRGTQMPNLNDVASDVMLGLGMNCGYFSAAETYVDSLPDPSNVILTGHSLGGAITQIVGNRKSLRLATFNAPGVAVFASRNILDANPLALGVRAAGSVLSAIVAPGQAWRDTKAFFNVVNGKNIRLRLDPVSMIGVHYGDVISIETPNWDLTTSHSITTVITALGQCGTGAVSI